MNGDSIGDYTDESAGWDEEIEEMEQERYFRFLNECQNRYHDAVRAETGATVRCPWCRKLMVKTTYNKRFCSNGRTKKGGNCKDNYWNNVDDKRRDRAIFINTRS